MSLPASPPPFFSEPPSSSSERDFTLQRGKEHTSSSKHQNRQLLFNIGAEAIQQDDPVPSQGLTSSSVPSPYAQP